MFVDSSAIVAMVTREVDAGMLADKLDTADFVLISPLVRYETILAVARKKWFGSGNNIQTMPPTYLDAAEEHLAAFVEVTGSKEMSITPEIGTAALRAMKRYGRGTGHPARLNFGDCFSYACARSAGVPLLFKGDDFIHTDIEPA